MTIRQSGGESPLQRNSRQEILSWIYRRLLRSLGPQGWWPAKSRLEVCIGVILTQNTAWANVEKAIQRLKTDGPLTVKRLLGLSEKRLADLIRPAGYFNVKAKRLRALLTYLQTRYGGSLDRLFRQEGKRLRSELLGVHGLGPESVDSILLYAGKKPFFVVDAYTQRILSRHGLLKEKASYEEAQELFVKNFSRDVRRFNEFHAFFVEVGKRFCRSTPRCWECPLDPLPRSREGYKRFLQKEKVA